MSTTAQSRIASEHTRSCPVLITSRGFSTSAMRHRRDLIDPQLAEAVRLRCARYHDCRLCQSVNSLEAALDERQRSDIDRYEESEFPEEWKAALRMTDAMITRPGDLAPEVRQGMKADFTDEQITELLLLIMKWSSQKVMVSLRADDAIEGVDELAYDADGNPVFGEKAVALFEQQ